LVKVRIAALPPSAEVAIVLASTFGLSTLLYGANILRHGYRPSIAFTNSRLLGLIVVEFVLGLLLAVFLHARGWRWEHLRVEVGWRPTLHGVALWIGSLFLIGAVFTVALSIPSLQSRLDTVRFDNSASLLTVILLCAINPFFEEALTVGYVLRAFRTQGGVFSVGLSALLRLAVHAYQGPVAVVAILPIGILFGWYFWKRHNLWPLILAHAIMDFVGFQPR